MDEDELAEVIGGLVEAGALDDERFALGFAADKRELRGWGPERIAEALRERGLDESLVEAALADEPGERVIERALEVLAESGAEAGDEAARARALALLARRGYPLEVAYDAVRALERNG